MESKDITITLPTITAWVGPIGFHRYASEFLRVARIASVEGEYSPVPYYLYGHSLELGLKAFCVLNKTGEGELKKLGFVPKVIFPCKSKVWQTAC
jgi:hypothetical protein